MKFIESYENSAPLTPEELESRRSSEKKSSFRSKAGRLALTGMVFVAGSLGTGELLGTAIDNSPTTKLQQSYDQQEKRQAGEATQDVQGYIRDAEQAEELHQQLPDDPNIHVG